MKIDKKDKTKIQFNDYVTISNIPKEAWDYKINDWSAPKWIIERYQYKKDKKTDIINDPNTYSEDPTYILKTASQYNNSFFKNSRACPKPPFY